MKRIFARKLCRRQKLFDKFKNFHQKIFEWLKIDYLIKREKLL